MDDRPMIAQNMIISQQPTLWHQKGSRVICGQLIVTPIENSFLYIVPLYLQAAGANFPRLKRVIAVSGDRVVTEPTLYDALNSLFAGHPASCWAAEPGTPPSSRVTGVPQPVLEQVWAQLEDARKAMEQRGRARFGVATQGLDHDPGRLARQ